MEWYDVVLVKKMTNNKRFVDNGCESVEDSGFTDTLTGKNYYVDYFDEIVDLVNKLSEENKKHTERYYQLIEHIQRLQKIIRENKTEKERQLEMELKECENFRHSIFKEISKINKGMEEKTI